MRSSTMRKPSDSRTASATCCRTAFRERVALMRADSCRMRSSVRARRPELLHLRPLPLQQTRALLGRAPRLVALRHGPRELRGERRRTGRPQGLQALLPLARQQARAGQQRRAEQRRVRHGRRPAGREAETDRRPGQDRQHDRGRAVATQARQRPPRQRADAPQAPPPLDQDRHDRQFDQGRAGSAGWRHPPRRTPRPTSRAAENTACASPASSDACGACAARCAGAPAGRRAPARAPAAAAAPGGRRTRRPPPGAVSAAAAAIRWPSASIPLAPVRPPGAPAPPAVSGSGPPAAKS